MDLVDKIETLIEDYGIQNFLEAAAMVFEVKAEEHPLHASTLSGISSSLTTAAFFCRATHFTG